MFKNPKRWLTLMAITLAACGALAQDFPVRTVKILVPQTPGGASDARFFQEQADDIEDQHRRQHIDELKSAEGQVANGK